MGLSEHEQRMLDELEKGLRDQDAKFVQRVASNRSSSAPRIVAGILIIVTGVSTLVLAAVTRWIPIGIAGFVIMLVGLLLATSGSAAAPSADEPTKPAGPGPRGSKPSSVGGIGDYFEKRWNRRNGRP